MVEGCSEKIDEFKIAKIVQQNYENEFKSFCTVYIVLFSVFWTISIGIGTVFIYFYWYSKRRYIEIKFIKYINGKYQTNKH